MIFGEVEHALLLLLGLSDLRTDTPPSQRHLFRVPFGQRFSPLLGLIYNHHRTPTGLILALPDALLIARLTDADQSPQTRWTRDPEGVLAGPIAVRSQLIVERLQPGGVGQVPVRRPLRASVFSRRRRRQIHLLLNI